MPSLDNPETNPINRLPQPPKPSLPSSINFPSTVINLSSINLDPPSPCLLEKGFNFSLVPHRIPMEDIICSIESIMHYLPTHEAKLIK